MKAGDGAMFFKTLQILIKLLDLTGGLIEEAEESFLLSLNKC